MRQSRNSDPGYAINAGCVVLESLWEMGRCVAVPLAALVRALWGAASGRRRIQ